MKKSELRQMIQNEIRVLREWGPSDQQIKKSQANNKLFVAAEKAYKDFLKDYEKYQATVKGKPNPAQLNAIRAKYMKAHQDIAAYIATDSEAMYSYNSAANKLVTNWKKIQKELWPK